MQTKSASNVCMSMCGVEGLGEGAGKIMQVVA